MVDRLRHLPSPAPTVAKFIEKLNELYARSVPAPT
jgi:hypothetical protein